MYVGVDTLNMKINLFVIPVVITVVSFANGVTGFSSTIFDRAEIWNVGFWGKKENMEYPDRISWS